MRWMIEKKIELKVKTIQKWDPRNKENKKQKVKFHKAYHPSILKLLTKL